MRLGMILLFAILYLGFAILLIIGKKRQNKILWIGGLIGLVISILLMILIIINYG